MTRFFLVAGLALATSLAFAQSASAAIFTDLIGGGGQYKISDDSGEFLVDLVTPVGQPANHHTLDVGDVIITGFSIHTLVNQTVGSTSSIGGGGANNSVNGVSALQVGAIIFDAGGNPIGLSAKPLDSATLTALGAKTSLALVNTILSTWAHDGAGNLQTMVALYNAPTNNADFTQDGGVDDGDLAHTGADIGGGVGLNQFLNESIKVATATVGSKLAEFGFLGLPGEAWTAVPSAGIPFGTFGDVLLASQGAPSDNFGAINFRLNQTSADQFTTQRTQTSIFSPGNTFDLTGNANVQGTNKGHVPVGLRENTPFDIVDDLNATFAVAATVPEPGSIVLFGLGGLTTLVAGAWRRRPASKA